MNSRERVLATLQHSEPDRIPFDVGGAPNTGMHIIVYRNLLKQLGYDREVKLGDAIFQTALIDEDLLQHLKVDLRGLDFSVFGSEKIASELKEDEKYFFSPVIGGSNGLCLRSMGCIMMLGSVLCLEE